MDLDSLRAYCLSLPHATEDIQWGDNLLFRIGGKIFAIASLEPDAPTRLAFKCSPERFAELLEIVGTQPAPYLARAKWVALEHFNVLRDDDLREVLRESYDLVFAKLPKKTRESLAKQPPQRALKKARAKKASG
jgi:predicted DNA-binding protein (MmcQ/YjbR family)